MSRMAYAALGRPSAGGINHGYNLPPSCDPLCLDRFFATLWERSSFLVSSARPLHGLANSLANTGSKSSLSDIIESALVGL